MSRITIALLVLLAITLGACGYTGYVLYTKTKTLDAAEERIVVLETALGTTTMQKLEIESALATEKGKNDLFASQIGEISSTVGKLDKLAKTDPELLQKYSKVYFLNENYVPVEVTQIPEAFVLGEAEYVTSQAYPFFEDLLEAAKDDGIDLRVVSGYRSFGTQGSLKASYSVRYGSGANTFSADQGYSEHQLGTTVDFTTAALGGLSAAFDTTEAYTWLTENAYKYGFILSYPKGNTFYVYEPWHWRFVGRDLARDLHRDGKQFYDLDQREIDEYLITLFD